MWDIMFPWASACEIMNKYVHKNKIELTEVQVVLKNIA